MMKTKSESLSIQRAKPMIEQKNKKTIIIIITTITSWTTFNCYSPLANTTNGTQSIIIKETKQPPTEKKTWIKTIVITA